MSEDEILAGLADYVAREAAENFRGALAAFKCESPIERIMLAAFMANAIENVAMFPGMLWSGDSLLAHCWSGSTDYVGSINHQLQIGPYRVDFYLQAFGVGCDVAPAKITKQWLRLVIECDGHDYHERTKEQARADKRRDRWFQTREISVLRFTGSEIWADPLNCADQVADAFFAAWHRYQGRE
jgi:very-short-patch-repair endonuclease